MKRAVYVTIALSALCAACTDSVDKAAKKRIFSPEDPPQAIAAAAQKLPPEDVADNSAIARRVLGMTAAEVTERIGAHQFTAKVTFEWSSGSGRTVRLTEDRTLLAGPGGMSGDFQAVMTNSRELGLEVLRVKSEVFARSKDGKFRQRLRDRGIAERVRNEMYGAIADFDQLFDGRLKLTANGTQTVEGRTAWKYLVSLGEVPGAKPEGLPALMAPRNGVDETTARRLRFYAGRVPRTLQGEVLVDSETSVVLKTRLDGRIAVKGQRAEAPSAAQDGGVDGGSGGSDSDAELRLVLDSALTNIGKDPALKPPAEFLPDQDKPKGIADALERFGIPRTTKDGGTAGPDDTPNDDND